MMSKATDFFNATGAKATPTLAATDAEMLDVKVGGQDADELLYKELLAALGRRGLATLHLPCEHCQGLSVVSIMRYPEVKMACRDAVAAWWRIIEAEAAKRAAT